MRALSCVQREARAHPKTFCVFLRQQVGRPPRPVMPGDRVVIATEYGNLFPHC